MEQVVTVTAEDQRFPVPGCHDLLPEHFPMSDIFHFPNVMNLKWASGCLAIFAFVRVQSSDEFRSTERERKNSGRSIHLSIVDGCHFEVFGSEYSDGSRPFLSLHRQSEAIFCFQPFDDLIDAGFVLVCQCLEQASFPNVVELVHVCLDIERQHIIVHQSPKFAIEHGNDLGITLLRQLFPVDCLRRRILSVSFCETEFLQFPRWNMKLKFLGYRFEGGMARSAFHFDRSVP